MTVATPGEQFEAVVAQCVNCGETIIVRPLGSDRWVHETGRAVECDSQQKEWTL